LAATCDGHSLSVRMLKPTLLACLALLTLAPPALAQSGYADAGPASAHSQFARFGGGGAFSRGSRGFGTRPRSRGFGSRSRGRGLFRNILRALAIGYLLHLLFTTPGGLLVLVLMILAVVLLMSRLRRRRVYRF
jgi:hypothetical protein